MALRGADTALHLTPPPPASSIQPAGVDLRVERVYALTRPGILKEDERTLPPAVELEPRENAWRLGPGGYKIRFAEAVEIPRDTVGFCYPRSSLLRMGATLSCGVWDPGYRGRGEALLAVFNPGGLVLGVGARVAQLVLIRMERPADRLYEGAYQGENL